MKRGLVDTCAYADELQDSAAAAFGPASAPVAAYPPSAPTQAYYEYAMHTFPATPSAAPQPPPLPPAPPAPPPAYARPAKRPRELTEDEAAQIVRRDYSRGDFIVGSSAPVRIDPRLPVKLVLGEGDHVHFTIGALSGYPGL